MSTINKTNSTAYDGEELKVANNSQPFDEEDLNTGKLLKVLNSIHELQCKICDCILGVLDVFINGSG